MTKEREVYSTPGPIGTTSGEAVAIPFDVEMPEYIQRLQRECAELRNLLEVSDDYRRAYADGKYKLYAMGGEIAAAAAEHLPMSEGPLDRAVDAVTGALQLKRIIVAERKENAALRAERDQAKRCSYSAGMRDADLARIEEVAKERDALAARVAKLTEALKGLMEEYECQESQYGNEYIWRKYEDPSRIQFARAALNPPATTQPTPEAT